MAKATAKAQRSRQSAADMVRSLGLVLGIVVFLFFLAQPPHSDARKIRVVDPTSDVQAFAAAAPGVPVPRQAPAGWRSTVSSFDPASGELRVGWVTAQGGYAEYAAAAHPAGTFLTDLLGGAPAGNLMSLSNGSWQQYRQGAASSLVRRYGPAVVVVGTLRDTASVQQLAVLAAGLRA